MTAPNWLSWIENTLLVPGSPESMALTNRTSGDVDWVVRAMDSGGPGTNNGFSIQLSQFGAVIYTTFPDPDVTTGGSRRGGGNVQLHKPNRSTAGSFSTDPATCPAAFAEQQ